LKRIRLLGEARAELLHETAYYEGKREGTGRAFRESVNEAFALICRFPQGGAPAPSNTRRTKVKGFPFTVIYREVEREIVVFAIAPDRRQPGYWAPRALNDG
jgi:ParE toxin of type II toxin-antitoxin system, parDE